MLVIKAIANFLICLRDLYIYFQLLIYTFEHEKSWAIEALARCPQEVKVI
jgi:hypothetical protein